MAVYLIHTDRYKHMGHYVGYAKYLSQRIAHHRAGTGSMWLAFLNRQGIAWKVARVWPDAGKDFERKLKRSRHYKDYCPICSPKKAGQFLYEGSLNSV